MTVILHQGKILKNLYFESLQVARNYLKMNYYNRKFKEPEENVFVCTRFGSTFKIIELQKY